MKQTILKNVGELAEILPSLCHRKLLLVHDAAYPFLSVKEQIERLPVPLVPFSDFQPNPL